MFRPIRNHLTAFAAMAIMTAAGCSNTSLPTDAAMDPRLAAQQQANLIALATERQASNARFDSLTAVWNNRGNGSKPMTAAGSGTPDFVPCAPLPFAGQTQIVGAAGGVFTFGPHKLIVPAGALSSDVSIAVMVTTSLHTDVKLLPHGTQFAVPVKLHLVYSSCDAAVSHRVAYIDASGTLLEWTTAVDHPSAGYIDAILNHFSEYAVAY